MVATDMSNLDLTSRTSIHVYMFIVVCEPYMILNWIQL